MNKDKFLVAVIAILLLLGVIFLCLSMFGENQENHHPLPIALCCIFSANALVIVRNKKRNKR
ncbi:MAG: hypothetical protein PUC35_00895 [Prevotellaceae bacterium]|nr:hypothetical protein [Prevotellaceae bacterium]